MFNLPSTSMISNDPTVRDNVSEFSEEEGHEIYNESLNITSIVVCFMSSVSITMAKCNTSS